jgi:hypothetical protein
MTRRTFGIAALLLAMVVAGNAFAQSADEVKHKAEKTSAKSRASADKKMDASAKDLDRATISEGEKKVAERLGTQFGMSADAITAEKNALNTSWGNLTIAHTLAANAGGGVTAEQLVGMHSSGMGWGQIAAGLGLKLGEAISAVRAENRVAKGLAKANGKVAVIHHEGTKAAKEKTSSHAAGMGGATKVEHGGGKSK